MNNEKYLNCVASLTNNSKFSTVEKLLNYKNFSIKPCPDFSIKDNSSITLYSYAGKYISFEPLYIIPHGKLGMIQFLKSGCETANLRKMND